MGRLAKLYSQIGAALDAPILLNGAIKRGDMLPTYMCAKTVDATWLVIQFHPADADDRPDMDTLEIKLLDPRGEGHWYVDVTRGRDPAGNGDIVEAWDGLFDDVPPADKRSCRKLIEALDGAALVEMGDAREAA